MLSRSPVFWLTIALLFCGCGAATGLLGDGESGMPQAGAAGEGSGGDASGGAIGAGSSAGGVMAATGGKASVPVSAEQLDVATAVCGATHWLFAGSVPNSRGLGGVPLDNGSVNCGRLYRGSQLATLGATGCAEFASLGIRSVIDLRTASEAGMAPSPTCVTKQADYVAAPMPTPYSVSAADYIADLHAHESLLAAFANLGDVSNYPVYIHCVYGRDRTAVLVALILRLLGASREVVMTEYMRTEESGLGVAPTSLQATLSEIERLGGAEAFLLSIGVPAKAIAVLRAEAATVTAP